MKNGNEDMFVNQIMVSLTSLARQLDAHPSTVRRWLRDAGVRPTVVGTGRNAAIRYEAAAVRAWLESRERIA